MISEIQLVPLIFAVIAIASLVTALLWKKHQDTLIIITIVAAVVFGVTSGVTMWFSVP